MKLRALTLAAVIASTSLFAGVAQAQTSILNASYDIARELFQQINPVFQEQWKEQKGEEVEVKQSHAGSSRQAQSIMQGLKADVVTFNQVTDVQILHDRGKLIPADWQQKLPNNSSPYYSTMAYLVRKGNPKNIQNWDDLARPDVKLVFPNPKTSGNGRYTYLAAWLYANKAFNGDEAKIKDLVGKLLSNVVVFDTGGRAATVSFVERGLGDVLITFESEVNLIRKEYGEDKYEVVVPKASILAEFPVAVVEKVAESRGTTEVANAYLDFLYQPKAQRILAENFYRVHDPKVKEEFANQFPEVDLISVESVFGSWDEAMNQHFNNGGVLDQLLRNARK